MSYIIQDNLTATKFITPSGTSTQYLMADGSTSIGVTDANAIHKSGDEGPITGLKTFTPNSGSTSISLNVSTTSTRAIDISHSGNIEAQRITNSSTGQGMNIYNQSTGMGLFVDNLSTGVGLTLYGDSASSGDVMQVSNSGTISAKVNKLGQITAAKYIISGGTPSQYLMADGSVSTLTNNVTGTGTNGQHTEWNGTNSIYGVANNTAFNVNFETTAANILMDGIQSVGTLNTVARADHRHPSDTSREPAIIGGATSQYWRGDKTWQTLDPNGVLTTADGSKNVLSATKLTTARTINGVSFDGTANITVADATKEPAIVSGTTTQYWRGDKSWQTLDPNGVLTTADANKNVLSATKLTTARAINGVNFDGTAAITIYDSTKLPLAGGTLTGPVDMGANKITASYTPTATNDLVNKQYADGLVVGLWDDRGSYNASSNTYPSTGGSGAGGAILKGDIWTISAAGTLGGLPVTVGDTVRALSDSPGQTSTNWGLMEGNLGYVPANDALVVHLSGNETISGTKTFNSVNSSSVISLNNSGTNFNAPALSVTNTNTNSFGAEFMTSAAGVSAARVTNNSYAYGLQIDNTSTGTGLLLNGVSTGYLMQGLSGSTSTSSITRDGVITGTKFVVSGKTSGDVLLGDGTTTTKGTLITSGGGTTGSGSINSVPKWSTSSNLANSNISDSGSLVTIASNTTINGNAIATTSAYVGGGAKVASAIVQADSTTQGFLPPRMTQTQRNSIASPAVGLMVYQTDGAEGFYGFTSGGWRALGLV